MKHKEARQMIQWPRLIPLGCHVSPESQVCNSSLVLCIPKSKLVCVTSMTLLLIPPGATNIRPSATLNQAQPTLIW